MKKIYLIEIYEPEAQGFFDEDEKVLHWWFSNDANYRPEYMDPLLAELGIEVICPEGKLYDRLEKKLLEEVEKY